MYLDFLEGLIDVCTDSGISRYLLDTDRVLFIDIGDKSECCVNNVLLGMLCCERKFKNKNSGGPVRISTVSLNHDTSCRLKLKFQS
jgi:hypothetical protein